MNTVWSWVRGRPTGLELNNQKCTEDEGMECPDMCNQLEESWTEWQALTPVAADLELMRLCGQAGWEQVGIREVEPNLASVGEDVRFAEGKTHLLAQGAGCKWISVYGHSSLASLLYHPLRFSHSLGILLWLQLHKSSLCFALFWIICSFTFLSLTSWKLEPLGFC